MYCRLKKSFGTLIILLFFLGLTASCSKNDSVLKDGYYTAEEAEFNSHGWKEYLTICISGGKIILVEYNAYNPSGFIKSWDMDYMRKMNVTDGTYPNAYSRYYGRQLLERQSIEGIDALSGATESYQIFNALAKSVLENARQGSRNTSLVSLKEAH
jgi:major membrane immunogen (membrane-anchored lipoprotein)